MVFVCVRVPKHTHSFINGQEHAKEEGSLTCGRGREGACTGQEKGRRPADGEGAHREVGEGLRHDAMSCDVMAWHSTARHGMAWHGMAWRLGKVQVQRLGAGRVWEDSYGYNKKQGEGRLEGIGIHSVRAGGAYVVSARVDYDGTPHDISPSPPPQSYRHHHHRPPAPPPLSP